MAFARKLFHSYFAFLTITLLVAFALAAHASSPAPAAKTNKTAPPADTIIFTNGDELTGTFVREVAGAVTFHSAILGDIDVPWAKIRQLRANGSLAVLSTGITPRHGKVPRKLPVGSLAMAGDMITVHAVSKASVPPIPVKNAQYILDKTTLDKQLYERPGFFAAWNGSATGGATVVEATEKQYTFSGGVNLARVVPTVTWLDPTNRTTLDFTGSYGKIIQPAYTSEGVFYPATDTKSSIYHADAERDEYFSPRAYALTQTSFDHNYSQGLDLQQIYGSGLGYTVIKKPKQELDIKATVQYEKQNFINATDGINQNLVGSTFAANYFLKLPHGLVLKQNLAYIPAWNNLNAYSATESNTVAIPFYKNLSFSLGSLDSYLNNPPPAVPPTMRNSFQFTFGATYLFKSQY